MRSLIARVRARVHLPALSVLLPYLGTVAGVVADHPGWIASAAGKLGVSAAIAVPVVLALLKPLAKPAPAAPSDGARVQSTLDGGA
jgi:hypothetical protein